MPDDAVECFSPRFREPNDLSITHFRSLGVLWSGWLPALFELGDEVSSSDFSLKVHRTMFVSFVLK